MAISKISNLPNIVYAASVDPTSRTQREEFISSWEGFNFQLKNTTVSQLNQSFDEVDVIYVNINTLENTVVAKEALMNPHYAAIDINATSIDSININALNITAIQNANANATTAIEQAVIATEQAVTATEQAELSDIARIAAESAVSVLPVGTLADLIIAPDKTWSSEKIAQEIASIISTDINTPTITSPANGAVDFIGEITSSVYSTSANYEGVQDKAIWEASTTSDFTNIVDTSTNGNITSWTPSIDSALTEAFVRVRYGSDNHLSGWSETLNFTTPDIYIETPTITVSGTPSDIGETPTITMSAFSVYNGIDTQLSSTYEVRKQSDNTLVWSSENNETDLLSITVPAGYLEVDTPYIFSAKQTGNTYGSSAFVSVSGTTKDAFTIPIGTAGTKGFGVAPTDEDFASLGLSEMSGTNTEGSDNYGNYEHTNGSIVCWNPKAYYRVGNAASPNFTTYGANTIEIVGTDVFATEVEANAAGYKLHRVFKNNGAEVPGYFMDKYMNSKYNNDQGASIFGGNPIGMTSSATYNPSSTMTGAVGMIADAVPLSRARGARWNVALSFMYGWAALLSLAQGQSATNTTDVAWYDGTDTTNFPKGCNNGALSDVNDATVTYTASPDTAAKPLTGATANFAKTTHNGSNNGIADLNGGLYEPSIGITSPGTTATATTAIANDTIYILKDTVDHADMLGGWDGVNDFWGNTTNLSLNFDSFTSPHALGSTTGTVYWGNGTNAVIADDERIAGIIPKDDTSTDATGTNQFGNDYLYRYNRQNLSALCCGYWGLSADAGLFCRRFDGGRSDDNSYCSFRASAYV